MADNRQRLTSDTEYPLAMSKLTRSRVSELLRVLFEILLEHPEGIPPSKALKLLANRADLTPYELEVTKSGRERFAKRLYYSATDLRRSGWLITRDGKWLVTEAGKRAYTDYPTPSVFFREAEEQRLSKQYGGASKFAEEKARQEIKDHLLKLDPYDFQAMVASLLRAMGYFIKWEASRGKDGGTDIVAWSDPLGVRPPRIKVQVKRTREAITVEGLRSFLAILANDDVGLFVTTSTFTKDAEKEARLHQNRKITLVHLEMFVQLWIEHYSKLEDAARRHFPLKPIYFVASGN